MGGAVAAVTARRLEHATGVQSSSLARLLHAPRSTGGTAVPTGGVLVVDEASMVDTRMLATLLAQIRAAGGTLVLVGDPAQLPEVGAGGLFAALARHEDALLLTDNRRQIEDWERRALADLRAGDPEAALDAYVRHDRVHAMPADRLVEQLVDDYLRHLDQPTPDRPVASGDRVVMLAVRRSDVAELNDAVRQRLIADGRLGERAVIASTEESAREYRAGDRVLVRANDHRRGLLNGTRAEVTAVDPRHGTLTVRPEVGLEQTVPVGWAAHHLDHGYAMTCHKAQGATVDVALVYGGGGLTREAGYVALSRGRTANHLYVPESTEREVFAGGRDGLDLVAARLWARRAQVLATRQLPLRTSSWASPTHLATPSVRAEGISR
jgi:ATP-dependent exoDNAse (exonuclease V) alpha subunit